VRVLIFHGYLLGGTGSNVYNASLAQALARLGHEVHLFCQDRRAHELAWVGTATESGGSVTVHVPDIGGLLPVYVPDRYEGFEVKTFPELTEAELGAYLDANVGAVRRVVASLGGVDAALANHLVMGPAILARAGVGFAAKIHGSALEYTVKPHPERFLPYAREGMEAARGVLVGSRHTAESLWAALDDPDLPPKTRLGPPGVDTSLFSPIPRDQAAERLLGLSADLRPAGGGKETSLPRVARHGGPPPASNAGGAAGGGNAATGPAAQGAWQRDTERAADAIEHFAAASGPRVVIVSKLIVSKGVDLLLAAWPLVHRVNPGARLLVVGFGEYATGLERLWAALSAADLERAREIAARGWALEGGQEKPLRMLGSFLADPPAGFEAAAHEAAASVAFTGRLEHEEVGRLVPAADALVFPSTFPEAFGMVAAEAAAAGVLPVSAAHSGAAEVSGALAPALPPQARELVSFPLDERAVEAIAARLNGWLALDEPVVRQARTGLVETASARWSWEGVARGVLAAAAGRLDELAAVPGR
jgi:glycosyltransferase involved in cell wall biosynthesis